MAKEKKRCVKCRKSFDPELYSGLCPKCGAYNGRHMDTSALEHYIGSAQLGEGEHRKLHEKYDKGYDHAHPKYDSEKTVQKSAAGKFLKLLLITVIFLAIITVVMFVYSNIAVKSTVEAHVPEEVPPSSGTVVFDHTLLEAPITVSVLGAGIVQEIEGLSQKCIYAAAVRGGSEDYNFDAGIDEVFLQYTYEGNTYYAMPLSSYDLEAFCRKYHIWEDEVLSGYDLSGSSVCEGYLFFMTEKQASDFSLLFQLSQDESPSLVLQEAQIALDGFPEPDFDSGEEK